MYGHELFVHAGCVLRGYHVIVPAADRKQVIDLLHKGHPGNNRMKGLSRSFVVG